MASQDVKDYVQRCMDNSEFQTGHKMTYTVFLDVIKVQLSQLKKSSPKSKKTAFFKEVEKHLIAKCIVEMLPQ